MGEKMEATRGTLTLLRMLSEGPSSRQHLQEALENAGIYRNERTIRRWLEVLREAGFGIERRGRRYELRYSPVRIAFDEREALATLSVLESLANREPVYGDHLTSAVTKLREALPNEALNYVDSGKIEFALDFASDPPEDPNLIDVLRQTIHRSQRLEILYHSLQSDDIRWRVVEPVRIFTPRKRIASTPTSERKTRSRSSGSTASRMRRGSRRSSHPKPTPARSRRPESS